MLLKSQAQSISANISDSFRLYKITLTQCWQIAIILAVIANIPNLIQLYLPYENLTTAPEGMVERLGITIISMSFLLSMVSIFVLVALIQRIYMVLHEQPGTIMDAYSRSLQNFIKVILNVLLILLLMVALFSLTAVLPMLFAGQSDSTVAQLLTALGYIIGIAILITSIVYFMFAMPEILFNQAGIVNAIKRSWRLTYGKWWRTVLVLIPPAMTAAIPSLILLAVLPNVAGWILAVAADAVLMPLLYTAYLVQYNDLRCRQTEALKQTTGSTDTTADDNED